MIKAVNITKIYNENRPDELIALHDVCIDIRKGETVILKGPSGSGKSTLLNIIAGLIKPTSGYAELDGKNISALPEHFASLLRREKIGMIFQQFHLLDNMTAAENVAVPLIPTGSSSSEINSAVNDILDRLGMREAANRRADILSGGEKQRTAIARAMINKPEVILADEPTANLDEKLTTDLLNILRELKADGKTLIIATHDEAVINSGLGDRVIEMGKGG